MSLPIKATSKSIRAFCSSPIKVSSFQSSLKFVPITFPAFPNSPPSYVLHIPSLSSESSVFSCENDAAKQSDHQYKQKIKYSHAKDAIPTNHPPSVSYTAYPLLCHIPVKHEYKRESYPTRHAYVYRNPAAAATPSKSLLQAPRLFYLGKLSGHMFSRHAERDGVLLCPFSTMSSSQCHSVHMSSRLTET